MVSSNFFIIILIFLYLQNRRAKKKEPQSESDSLSGVSDAEQHEDGSITLNAELEGWDCYPWTCCDCQLQAANADDLKDHHATVHGQGARYACADCPKVYSKYSTFLSHVRSHRTKLKFCCDACGKWFPSTRQQERHRAAHGDERPHACATCGKR